MRARLRKISIAFSSLKLRIVCFIPSAPSIRVPSRSLGNRGRLNFSSCTLYQSETKCRSVQLPSIPPTPKRHWQTCCATVLGTDRVRDSNVRSPRTSDSVIPAAGTGTVLIPFSQDSRKAAKTKASAGRMDCRPRPRPRRRFACPRVLKSARQVGSV